VIALSRPLFGGPRPTVDDYLAVRAHTESLAEPLSPEDQTVQTMADVSPTKWHRAHVTWFFEQFVLLPHRPGYEAVDDRNLYLFNSYYESAGPRHPRDERGYLTRPGAADVTVYRSRVDDAMGELLGGDLQASVAAIVELGLHHEQQHQELLLMDIKHVFGANPFRPAYHPELPAPGRDRPFGWREVEGGLVDIGAPTDGSFTYDNETPTHRVWLEPYAIADRLVSTGDWLAFMADGGYHRPDLWLSDGWATIHADGREAPLYWESDGEGGWRIHTLAGLRPVDLSEPVVHIDYYEADAFAHWAGARLPTEAEWEHAAAAAPSPRPVTFHPRASDDGGWYGQVWQWTASAYLPYPRFVPAPGMVGEYNGKFMSGQHVLRGSACITPAGHARRTYRNFFPPAAQWPFTGLRLARSLAPRPLGQVEVERSSVLDPIAGTG
jgi:ergothioneine biosynthesis protein EgtB